LAAERLVKRVRLDGIDTVQREIDGCSDRVQALAFERPCTWIVTRANG